MSIADLMRVPASQIPVSPQSARWAKNFWKSGSNQGTKLPNRITFGCGFEDVLGNDFSQVVITIPKGTDLSKIMMRFFPRQWETTAGNVTRAMKIPVPKFDTDGSLVLPPDGTDAQISFVVADTGEAWNLWRCSLPWDNRAASDRPNQAAGDSAWDLLSWLPGGTKFNPGSDGVATGYEHILATDPTNGATVSPAIPMHIVVTPEEVLSGTIGHAMAMSVSGLCSMNGPPVPKGVTITDINDPRIGTQYGAAASPALKMETQKALQPLEPQVPDGTRIIANPAQFPQERIDDWIADSKATGVLAASKRTFVANWISHGAIQTATSSTTGPVMILGNGSTRAKKLWTQAGIGDVGTANHLHDNLFTSADDFLVLQPPTITMKNGTKTTLAALGTPSY